VKSVTRTTKKVTRTEKVTKTVAQKVKGGSRIEVQSAGFTTGNLVIINVAGKKLVTKEDSKRGLNVIALDAVTHKVILNRGYDTYGS